MAGAVPGAAPNRTATLCCLPGFCSLQPGRFLHPKLGFTFAAPDTFTLDNTAQAVIGVRGGGTQAMRFDVVRVPAEQSLGSYLSSGWMENVDKASIEELTVNGFPVAASACATSFSWCGKTRSTPPPWMSKVSPR